MSDPTVRGKVHVIEDTKTFGKSGFRKRLVVLEQDKGKFTNYVPLEFVHEGCDSVDDMNVGDEVDVTYRLSGRKWQRDANSEVKYFLNAEALDYRVVKGTEGTKQPASADDEYFDNMAEDDDEVPF
jgi:hypothetical protein